MPFTIYVRYEYEENRYPKQFACFLFIPRYYLRPLNRYPRWGDAEDDTTSALANSKSPPSVDSMTAKSHEEERGFERAVASSSRFDHLGNISNLSASVQKLLRDFATDSDELTKFDSDDTGTAATSTADTLPPKADITQVLDCCSLLYNLQSYMLCKTSPPCPSAYCRTPHRATMPR